MPIRHLSAFASAKELRKESRWTGDYHVRYILYTYTLKYLYVIIYIHTYIYIYIIYIYVYVQTSTLRIIRLYMGEKLLHFVKRCI